MGLRMTIVTTSSPKSGRERLAEAAVIGTVVLIVGLFVFSIFEAYAF
jgi:hypothetical protein